MPAAKSPETNRVVVLAVTPFEEDDAYLREIFSHSNWSLRRVDSCAAAQRFLRQTPTPVVLCERQLYDGEWRDVLSMIGTLSQPSHLIVTSRHADERLWSEVLNLGGYDLLEKPFDKQEVFRVISLAWRHWKDACAVQSAREQALVAGAA
jgi:DNA-binding NtrC family response regulator